MEAQEPEAMSIAESLTKQIEAGERAGITTTEFHISDAAARELAIELSALQPGKSPAALFASMKAGTAKFMDRLIVVAGR